MTDRKIQTAVVTGPTGAIGTALCQELAERGIRVYAVCRPGSHRASVLPQHNNIIPVFCDLSQLAQLPEFISGSVDAFYHLAWAHTIGSGRNDMTAQTDNIRYTIDAVRTAKVLNCRVFIGAGSQAEYGRVEGNLTSETPCFPENGYGMAKLCAGQMSRVEAERLGMDHIWVRVLSVYGPGDGEATMISTVIRLLLAGQKPDLTPGQQQWDYLYSTDAAHALYLAAKHGVSGRVYPLGSGKAQPLKTYVEILRDAIDPTLPLGFGQVPYGNKQVMYLQADISQLCRDTLFEPQVAFSDGIRQTIKYYKEKEYGK